MELLYRCKLLLAVTIFLFGVSVLIPSLEANAQKGGITEKPNVVFIAIEDFTPKHLGIYGGPVKTPNLDRLASEGVIFKNAYSQVPVCNPSRTALLTGLRPPNSGVFGNSDNWKKLVLPDIPVTMPQHFKQNGYNAVKSGKIFHYQLEHPDSWDRELSTRVEGIGGCGTEDRIEQISGHAGDKTGWQSWGTNKWMSWIALDCEPEQLRDGRMTINANEFLAEDHNKPFFLGIGYHAPHLKFAAPKQFFDLYDLNKISLPDNPKNDLADMPAINSKHEIHEYVTEQKWREIKRAQFATMSYIDWNIGEVLDALEQNGLKQNTIVVVWTDHGFMLGEHFQWAKGGAKLFEETANVGFMWKVPGVTPRGEVSSSIVETIDIFPTLFDLTNIPIPDHVDGESMVELLQNPQMPWKKAAYSWASSGERVSIQTGRYRLNVDRDLDPASFELYDHKYDPQEHINVSYNPQYKPVIDNLISNYKDHKKKYSLSE